MSSERTRTLSQSSDSLNLPPPILLACSAILQTHTLLRIAATHSPSQARLSNRARNRHPKKCVATMSIRLFMPAPVVRNCDTCCDQVPA